MLKHAIIGCGGISPKHLNGYGALKERVKTVAACDIDPEALARTAERYGIERRYTDYHELLRDSGADLVSVCLPNYLHKQVSIDAMRAGLNVHCEKPMAMNYAEAREMLDVRDRTGKKLIIGLNNRFMPSTQFARRYIEEGKLGEIYFAQCGWTGRNRVPPSGWFTEKALSGGGPLIDLGVHMIDLTMHLMGYPKPEAVLSSAFYKLIKNADTRQMYAWPGVRMRQDDVFDVEDLAAGTLTLEGGKSVEFRLSWASNTDRERRYYELYGTKGNIRFEDERLMLFTTACGQMVDITPRIAPELYPETEFSVFLDSIEKDAQPERLMPEDAAQMMRIIDGIYASAETRKPVLY